MNWPNRLECLTLVCLNSCVIEQSNLLGRFVSYEENGVLWILYQTPTLEWSTWKVVLDSGKLRKHYTRLEILGRNKHSSLLWALVNYGCKKYYDFGPRRRRPRSVWRTLMLTATVKWATRNSWWQFDKTFFLFTYNLTKWAEVFVRGRV